MENKVFTLEGAPCAGKSTLRANLENSLDSRYTIFLPTLEKQKCFRKKKIVYPENSKDLMANSSWFISQEAEKINGARNNYADKTIAVLERDYLSSLAFAYAYSNVSGIDSFEEIKKQYGVGNFPQPDLRFLLIINPDEILRRNNIRDKKLDYLFSDKKFLTYLTDFFQNFESPNTIKYDSTIPPKDILELVSEKINYGRK